MTRYPPKPRVVRLSVSLSPELVKWTRAEAKEHGVTISAVVVEAIRALKRREMSAAMVAGLIEDASETP